MHPPCTPLISDRKYQTKTNLGQNQYVNSIITIQRDPNTPSVHKPNRRSLNNYDKNSIQCQTRLKLDFVNQHPTTTAYF